MLTIGKFLVIIITCLTCPMTIISHDIRHNKRLRRLFNGTFLLNNFADIMESTENNQQHPHKVMPTSMTAITDLNDDCLMEIFIKLSMEELVYVAEASTSLLSAARGTFQRNFSKLLVEVSNEFHPKSEDMSLSIKLLKHFGGQIKKLKVVYHKKCSRFNDILEDMILDRCNAILSEIVIVNGDELVFHRVVKPFQELLKMSFVRSNIPDVLLHFEKWFPKAKVLELKEVKVDRSLQKYDENAAQKVNNETDSSDNTSVDVSSSADSEPESGAESDAGSYFERDEDNESGIDLEKPLAALAKHYPTIEHFAISNVPMAYDNRENRVRNSDIVLFIELNPQLKSLFIESDDIDHDSEYLWARVGYRNWSYDGIEIEYDLVDCILQNLTSLEDFHLIWKTGKMSGTDFQIYFERLKTLTIEYHIVNGECCILTDNIDVLNIVERSHRNGVCADLLKSNRSAKIVSMTGINWKSRNAKNALKIMAKMPNLKELQLSFKSLKMEQVTNLLNNCMSLSKLTLDFDRDLQLYESSKEYYADTDLSEMGWTISSNKKIQLELKRVPAT